VETLAPAAGDGLLCDHPLARYTSFRIGGPADILLIPCSSQVLAQALAESSRLSIAVTKIGGGTNILVSDAGVRGLVIRLGREFDYRRWSDADDGSVTVEVGASSRLSKLVRECVERGLSGLEFAAGIPGSVGGGALMNAGAFGGELADAIVSVDIVDSKGQRSTVPRSRLEFSYRRLALDGDVVIISIRFRLLRAAVGKLRRVVESVQAKRRRKQPLGFPNAGSVFKNPAGLFAGRLIEQAGLKGETMGRAQISTDHANFIVNLGGATAANVHGLMSLVQDAVWKRSGVWLEPEVRLIGEWDEAEAVSSQTLE